MICLDTSVIIDYFRKTNKNNTFLLTLTNNYSEFAVSVITEYEIMVGAKDSQLIFWEDFFEKVKVLEFSRKASEEAVQIYHSLRKTRKLIDVADLFIGATAKCYGLPLATMNLKHFSRIPDLELVSTDGFNKI